MVEQPPSHWPTMADNFINGVEDTPLEPPIQASSKFPSWCCCSCSYHVPTIGELFAREKRLLRAILLIVILLNAPVGKYILYPFVIFSTWIHESFHGIAGKSLFITIRYIWRLDKCTRSNFCVRTYISIINRR